MLRLISKNYPDLTTPWMVSISFFLYFDTESMLTRLILKRSGGKITISLRIEQIKLSKKFGNGGSMIFIGCGSNFSLLFFLQMKINIFFKQKRIRWIKLNLDYSYNQAICFFFEIMSISFSYFIFIFQVVIDTAKFVIKFLFFWNKL